MAQNDILKRYLDAGLSFTSMTQRRAEALVRDLVKAGEVQADQARDAVDDLVERSRRSSERLLETIRREVRAQITALGLVRQSDLDRIERRISALLGTVGPARQATAMATAPAAKKATGAKKTARAKVPVKKATTKKKAPAKQAPVKKAPTKKAATRKAPTRKAATKRAPAEKAAAPPASVERSVAEPDATEPTTDEA